MTQNEPPQGWQPPATAPIKKKRGKALPILGGIVGAIVLLSIIGAIAGGGSKKTPSPAGATTATSAAAGTSAAKAATTAATAAAPTGANADVTISACDSKTSFGGSSPTAHLTIKNNSSKASNYLITVAFNSTDGATQYDTGIASVSNLAPGQTNQSEAFALKPVTTAFVCKIVSVTRFAS